MTDVHFDVRKSLRVGKGSKIKGQGSEAAEATNASVSLSSSATLQNHGDILSAAVDIKNLSLTGCGKVENEGRIHTGTLSLANLETFRNTSETAELRANTAHLRNVGNVSGVGKIELKKLETFSDAHVDMPVVVAEPYTAKPGENLKGIKFLNTLTIEAGDAPYTLERVEAKSIIIKGKSISIGNGVVTEKLEITSTSTISFNAGITVDQIGIIIIRSGDVNIGGHINIAGFVATTNQITVEHNASLICTHIDLKGISASSLLKNKGKITSEKLFLTSSIKIRNESGATLSIPSMDKSPNLDVPDLITNSGLIEVKGNLSLMRAGCLGETGVWKIEGKFSILLGENCSIQCKDLHAHTIDIEASSGTVMGGFKAKQIAITAAEIHVTHETIATEKITFNAHKLLVTSVIEAPALSVIGTAPASLVSVKEKGRISTVNNIAWDNIHTLENEGIITTKADLELTNIPKIIQHGVLGSENNVTISAKSLTELTSDMYSDKKVIFGKTITIECKLVQGIKVSAIGAVTITAKDTLNVRFLESGGSVFLTAAQKIEASKLTAKGKITFSAAKLIFLGLEIKSDGDISIPAGGELSFRGSSKLSSKGTLVIKRRLRPNNSNAEISAHTVEWHLAGLTQQEQDEFLNGGNYESLQFLRVKAETIFKLHAPHPVHLTTLPKFLKDSNLEFFTSSFISSHKDEYPHSLDITLLGTRNFNAGNPLRYEARICVKMRHKELEIT